MILEIGIGILSFGIGLFVGSFLNSLKHKHSNINNSNNESLNMFAKWAQEKSKRELLEKEQKEKYEKLRQEALLKAQEQAFKEVQPELVEQLKQQEIRKITGQDKKDKLQKFADMFATSSSSNSKTNNSGGSYSSEKLDRMLGKSNVITPTKIYDAQGYVLKEQEDRSTDRFINNDKINMMLGKQSLENNNSKQRYSSVSKYQEQKAEEERLKRLVR